METPMEAESLMDLVKSRHRTRNKQGRSEYVRRLRGVRRVEYSWSIFHPGSWWWIEFEGPLSLEAIERVCRENNCDLVDRSEETPDRSTETMYEMLEHVGGAPLPRGGGYSVYRGQRRLASIGWWPTDRDAFTFSTGRRGLVVAEAYRRLATETKAR